MRIRYTPTDTSVSDYIVLDVFSCGMPRQMAIVVTGNGGSASVTQMNYTCGQGGVLRNEWDHLYADLTGLGFTSIDYVEIWTTELASTQYIYIDEIYGQSDEPTCDTVCVVYPSGDTCTPTIVPTNTPTHTECVGANGTDTCTPVPSATFTGTPTNSPTPTPTPTSTAWPIMVFPNPMDFQKDDKDDNCCAQYDPPITTDSGCIKFIGIPLGSTLKIYTLALALVRSFDETQINSPISTCNIPFTGPDPNTSIGWLAWDGDNDDRNPVSAGMYFYVVEPPGGEKVIGRLAISRARTLNP